MTNSNRWPIAPGGDVRSAESLRNLAKRSVHVVRGACADRERVDRAAPAQRTLSAHVAAHARSRRRGPTRAAGGPVLRYRTGDYNALHQDVYGALAFTLRGTVLLSEPQRDFTGGDFVLVEGRPRKQSVAHVVPLLRGELVVFPNRDRPAPDGGAQSASRHGVARLRSGERYALGLRRVSAAPPAALQRERNDDGWACFTYASLPLVIV